MGHKKHQDEDKTQEEHEQKTQGGEEEEFRGEDNREHERPIISEDEY